MNEPSSRSSLLRLVVRKLMEALRSPTTRRIIETAAEEAATTLSGEKSSRTVARQGGRPTARRTRSTRQVARKVVYAPDLDGAADPGEIVWTWVEYEENNGEGKDRPVLVVGRTRQHLLGLMLSSQGHRAQDPNWMRIGQGAWDVQKRDSYVRLDRVLEVPESGIRREGAVLDKRRFNQVAQRLRTDWGWS